MKIRRSDPLKSLRDTLRRYGLTPDSYHSLLKSQAYVCAVCGNSDMVGRRLAVDHCHSSGAVRGLLCSNCNTGLGQFRDDPALLGKAADYLRDNLETDKRGS